MLTRTRLAAIVGVVAVAATWTAPADPPSDGPPLAAAPHLARERLAAPEAPPAPPGPTAAAARASLAVPSEVPVHRPDLLVRGVAPQDLGAASGVDGLTHMTVTTEFTAAAAAPGGEAEELTLLGVEPATFRPLTPEETATEPAVWERLLAGEALVRHDVAERLGLELGGPVTLRVGDQQLSLRVGAFAANGAPPLADVIVPHAVADQFGRGQPNLLLIAVGDGVSLERAADQVSEALGGADVTVREPPAPQRSTLRTTGGGGRIAPFSYTEDGDGTITIDPAWVARWIVTVDLPRVGTARCHRVMVPQLVAAMDELVQRGLIDQLDPRYFAGCWYPRHIDWQPSKPLSMHAWGLAIDFNTHQNPLGARPRMDPAIVEVFERWGFEWGGTWRRPDGMHFELDRILTPAD